MYQFRETEIETTKLLITHHLQEKTITIVHLGDNSIQQIIATKLTDTLHLNGEQIDIAHPSDVSVELDDTNDSSAASDHAVAVRDESRYDDDSDSKVDGLRNALQRLFDEH